MKTLYYRTHFFEGQLNKVQKYSLVQSKEAQRVFNHTKKHFYFLFELQEVAKFFSMELAPWREKIS